jgi:drug/metabolite transporter (DMT)-like permease
MRPHSERTRGGAYLALAAAALFGASAPLAKALLASISPQLLAGLLYLGSGAGLAIYRRVRGAQREAALRRADAGWLAAAIAFGGVLGPLLLMIGLARTPAASASLLLNLEGVLTALLAWFVFRENYDRRIALGMAAIVSGGVVLTWSGQAALGGLAGPIAIAGACLCWAADKRLPEPVLILGAGLAGVAVRGGVA